MLKYFSYFSQKIDFDFSSKLSHLETICMKCQSSFSWKNTIKKVINVSSAEFGLGVVKVNIYQAG